MCENNNMDKIKCELKHAYYDLEHNKSVLKWILNDKYENLLKMNQEQKKILFEKVKIYGINPLDTIEKMNIEIANMEMIKKKYEILAKEEEHKITDVKNLIYAIEEIPILENNIIEKHNEISQVKKNIEELEKNINVKISQFQKLYIDEMKKELNWRIWGGYDIFTCYNVFDPIFKELIKKIYEEIIIKGNEN